jgi:type VI secretion system protein ImpL
MKKILLNRWFLGSVGIVLLALVLWFLGPYFAFGEARPFASVLGRVIAVLVLFAIWIGILQWQYLRAIRASRKLASEVAGQADAPVVDQGKPAEPADAAQLKQRFEDAVARLKKGRKGGGGLYELPWYVIIGPPGSGKTTALVNSGLRFPMEQEIGKRSVRGVGGTRNCDWWFTDEAILLDTAGRYTTQDSDRIADGAGWAQFLQLLKKHRRRQPINGVLVAYSASDLMVRSEQEFEGDITAIRQRIEELNRNLGITLPVYLLVTKADLIGGFREYFDDLDATGRAQVWGVTFPLEDSQTGRAIGELPSEFDALADRLNRGLFARLQAEKDARRRSVLFAFPQQFAALRPRLLELVNRTFGGTGFDRRSFLRGVYFTSGTQEGTPIDRLLGSMSRSLGVATDLRQLVGEKGRAYFIERLLKEVVLRESGLAGADRRATLRKTALHVAAYVALAALVVGGLGALTVSYRKNLSYLADVGKAAAPLVDAGAGAPVDTSAIADWLPRLEAVRGVVVAAERGGDAVPWSMRSGLYQGHSVGEAARDAYARELNALLVPQLAQTFASRMNELSADPDKLYEYLKGYLMLGDPRRLDPGQLGFLAQVEWSRAYGEQPDVRDALVRHLEALLTSERLNPADLDRDLVTRARNTLRAATPASLAYSRLKLLFAGDKYPPLRLDREVQGIETVFRRRSGRALAEPLPALYTKAVFKEISGAGTEEIARRLQEDAWVFGDDAVVEAATARLVYDVLALYERDYIAAWDELLADIQRVPLGNDPQQASRVLGILGSAGSPLKVLLGIASDNTKLSESGEGGAGGSDAEGLADKVADKAAGKALAKASQASPLGKLLLEAGASGAAASTRKPGDLVTEHFSDLHRLLDGPPGQAPIDRTIALLGQMSQCLGRMGDAVGTASAAQSLTAGGCADLARALEVEAGQLPAGAAGIVGSLAGETQAVVRDQAKGELADLYRSQVVAECNAMLGGRYPFVRGAATDVPVADFARLFGAGGVFDAFYTTHLAPFVDTSGTRWRWREASGGSLGLPGSILAQFEAVHRIRQQFFRVGGAEPELRFALTPEYLDATARSLTLEIDGQRLEYSHGPQPRWAVKWPSTASEQVAVTFDAGAGPGPVKVFEGPWAVLRFIDDSSPAPQTDTRFRLTVSAGGQTARLLLDASSIRNPFADPLLAKFRCGG